MNHAFGTGRSDAAAGTRRLARWCAALVLGLAAAGCGSTRRSTATEQLLQSAAVDQAVTKIDFSDLRGQSVFFDTQYIKDNRSSRSDVGDAAAGYVISSLRQQMLAAGCRLEKSEDDADFIVEARVGALGRDESEMIYGIPSSNAVGAAASAVSTLGATASIPTIPEIALARKDNRRAAAKVAAFAYHRESRQIVWQSGKSESEATAEDRWVLGAGPFQKGTIYNGVQFAGEALGSADDDGPRQNIETVDLNVPKLFVKPVELVETEASDSSVVPAAHEVDASE